MSSNSYDSYGYSDEDETSKVNTTPLEGKFFDLIRSHFSEIENFSAYDHILKVCGLDKWGRIDEIDISKILPGAKLICREQYYNVGYHSRECEARKVELYSYKDRYITFKFDLSSWGIESDLTILSIDHHYGEGKALRDQLQELFNDMVEITDSIDCAEFIRVNNVREMSHMIDLFHGIHKKRGCDKFEEYAREKYNIRTGHQR